MATLTLRSVKGSPLTNNEVDGNFTALNDELALKLTASTYTASDILTKLKTVDGLGSGLDADLLDGLTSSSTNVVSTIVARDASGNFAANTITASGFSGPLTGNVTGNVSGTAGGLSTTLALTSGGTGATTAAAARTNLGLGTLATQNANAVAITGGTISTLTNAIAIADGGTGANNAASARTNLGLQIGVDVQAQDGDLTAIAALATTGMIVRSATNTAVTRTISGGTGVTVTNGDGVSGNPSIAIGQGVSTADNVRFNSIGVGQAASGTAGEIKATTVTETSTIAYKQNINPLAGCLEKVLQLRPVSYDWKKEFSSDTRTQVGLIAEEVNTIIPEVVSKNANGDAEGIQYTKLVAYLIESIQELTKEIKQLKGE